MTERTTHGLIHDDDGDDEVTVTGFNGISNFVVGKARRNETTGKTKT
jgi:hypothetical protein